MVVVKGRLKRTIGIVAVIVLLVLAGGTAYLVRGLNPMMELEIHDVDVRNLPDGTYSGEFQGYRWANRVEVTVENAMIQDIAVIEPHPFHRQELIDTLTERIVERQTLQVETVTGATVSSKAFLKAVENALVPD